MASDKKLIFLAGSTGMVGSAILKYFIDNYPQVRIRAAYYKHTKPFIRHKHISYVYGDLKSEKDCIRMVGGCDAAIMAAASTAGAAATLSYPWEQVDDNVIMNVRLLRALHAKNIKRLVYVGSATLYQESESPIKEDELDFNKDPYSACFGIGWAMRFIEKLCKFWHEQTGIEIVMVRAANIFGPYARFNPLNSNFIPALIRKAAEKQDPFEVWGSPDVTRDVIFSDDFSRAIVLMLGNEKIKFDVFNIGSGIKTKVSDVVSWALKYSGHNPSKISYLADKPTTVKNRVLDCSKAKNMLGWQPQYITEEAIKKTTEWWITNRKWWKK